MPSFPRLVIVGVAVAFACTASAEEKKDVPDYASVFRIFDERCVECHTVDEPEGGLVLETHDALLKGGESGKAVEPGRSAESLLVRYLRGEVEEEGKRKFMPPGKRKKLDPEEIQLIARWIDAGAQPPLAGPVKPREINVPKITPKGAPRSPVYALAYSPHGQGGRGIVAVGRFGAVEVLDAATLTLQRRLEGHAGNVNAVVFSPDGQQLFAASGENGLFGEVKVWRVLGGELVRTIQGHRDTLYALALSPDGRTLATGSYDSQIKLWSVETGAEIKTLRGHNGAVFALGFRPDGRILASASADRTVKLWDVATGQRRDTLSQPTKEQVTLAWSADGLLLAAGGFDNRIRVWEVSAEAKETTNPLRHSRFAHEGPILRIVWSEDGKALLSSAQDGTVKLWDAAELKERMAIEKQPDWPSALAFLGSSTVLTGRLDGTLACYDAASGRARTAAAEKKPKPAKVEISGFEPRGLQRGEEVILKLTGKNLDLVKGVHFAKARPITPPAAEPLSGLPSAVPEDERVAAAPGEPPAAGAFASELLPGATESEVSLRLRTPRELPRGIEELTLLGADGKSVGAIKVHVDDLPQVSPNDERDLVIERMPASVWGALDRPGDTDRFEFEAAAGQTLVFDLASKSIGSKADAVLSLTDPAGHVLASNNDFDSSGDPLLAHTFKAAGRFALVVSDLQFGGSKDHFYRLSAGELPFVTACFPLTVPANAESEVELIGYNLPEPLRVKVKGGAAGEIALPLDGEKVRSRREFKLVVSDLRQTTEVEPNDQASEATSISVPGSVGGRLLAASSSPPELRRLPIQIAPATETRAFRDDQRRVPQAPETSPLAPIVPSDPQAAPGSSGGDADLFRFDAKKGSVWAIETQAAQRGTPVDTRIEVLHPDGKPVERLLLRAVRDSAITFRPIDSATADVRVENWQEMALNQLLYMSGEVAKIFRMPEGPDSGFQFYTTAGKRTAYFNTTATAHALDEPCYIVEPHPPGTKLSSNGLPVFPLVYTNDDDGDRKLGTDSRLLFTAPSDGAFLVRVTDSRGLSGERFVYQLIVREAKQDFGVNLSLAGGTINAGSGQGFTLTADRQDGFDAPIVITIEGVPEGYVVSTPLVIEAGHQIAKGCIFALSNAKPVDAAEWAKVKVTATASIAGESVARAVNGLGTIKLGEAPKVFVALEPAAPGDTLQKLSPPTPLQPQDPAKPLEITIAPGEIIPAWVKIKRNGHASELRFDVENLPHGVIVDNLGLNGITLLTGQNEGEIALKAEPWVEEMDRLCYVVTREVGKQTSLPVMLHVRRNFGTDVVSSP